MSIYRDITDLPIGTFDPETLTERVGDDVKVGDEVATYTRGRVRLVRVVKVGPKRLTVEYTTQGAIDTAWKLAERNTEMGRRNEARYQIELAERYERDAALMERLGMTHDGEFVEVAALPAEYVKVATSAQDRRTGRTYVSSAANLRKWAADSRQAAQDALDKVEEARAYDARPTAEKAAEMVHMTTFNAKRENVYKVPA